MRKIKKLIQCIRFRRIILGTVGKNNCFRPGVSSTSAAVIGNNNYFSERCMIGNADIGNYCSFGPDVKIAQSLHSINYITTFQAISKANIGFSLNTKRTRIDHDVWLGANVVVVQGVHIGTGAVVGANAVVTKDIPPYAIAVGVPAKVIKFRFDSEIQEKILESRWWEYELQDAIKKAKELECLINNNQRSV